MAIEEQDLGNVRLNLYLQSDFFQLTTILNTQFIEIHTYLTAKVQEDDINNIVANE